MILSEWKHSKDCKEATQEYFWHPDTFVSKINHNLQNLRSNYLPHQLANNNKNIHNNNNSIVITMVKYERGNLALETLKTLMKQNKQIETNNIYNIQKKYDTSSNVVYKHVACE